MIRFQADMRSSWSICSSSAFISEFDILTYLSSASYPRISFSRTRGPSCDKSHFQKDPCAHGFSLKFEFKYKEVLKFVQFCVKTEECRKISFQEFHMVVFGILKLIRKRLLRALALLKSLSIKI